MTLFAVRERVLDDRDNGCWVSLDSAFLDRAESEHWYRRLAVELAFVAESPVIFGKAITVRR